MTIVEATRTVTGGIDAHGETHVAAVLDEVGGLLGTESFEANLDGYSALFSWLAGFGAVGKVGVEGTGAYGAGLARFLDLTPATGSTSNVIPLAHHGGQKEDDHHEETEAHPRADRSEAPGG